VRESPRFDRKKRGKKKKKNSVGTGQGRTPKSGKKEGLRVGGERKLARWGKGRVKRGSDMYFAALLGGKNASADGRK